MNIQQIMICDIEDLAQWSLREYFTPIPEDVSIETIEGIQKISQMMVYYTNQYSFLASVLSYLKFHTRKSKQEKDGKSDELIDKKEIIQKALDTVKQKQSALSRMITIRQEINKELEYTKAM